MTKCKFPTIYATLTRCLTIWHC